MWLTLVVFAVAYTFARLILFGAARKDGRFYTWTDHDGYFWAPLYSRKWERVIVEPWTVFRLRGKYQLVALTLAILAASVVPLSETSWAKGLESDLRFTLITWQIEGLKRAIPSREIRIQRIHAERCMREARRDWRRYDLEAAADLGRMEREERSYYMLGIKLWNRLMGPAAMTIGANPIVYQVYKFPNLPPVGCGTQPGAFPPALFVYKKVGDIIRNPC